MCNEGMVSRVTEDTSSRDKLAHTPFLLPTWASCRLCRSKLMMKRGWRWKKEKKGGQLSRRRRQKLAVFELSQLKAGRMCTSLENREWVRMIHSRLFGSI
uniref:Uncharacterized protein n=1 Tax=Peronospora matthiolae TaxID=2874970 RepID=A0AAV1UPV7_9STRA